MKIKIDLVKTGTVVTDVASVFVLVACGTLVKSKCNFDFKFKNPPRVLSCIFGFEVCFLNSSLNPG